MKFRVKREHYGDRAYAVGDEREADEREVAHLVQKGVLGPVREKAEPKAANKAEPKASSKAKK